MRRGRAGAVSPEKQVNSIRTKELCRHRSRRGDNLMHCGSLLSRVKLYATHNVIYIDIS